MAVFQLTSGENDLNEIHQYQMGRYISSNKAVWRILNFPIHERHPNVIHLSVHLENGQRVYFTTENAAQRAQAPQETTLTSFFRLCTEDEFACTLLYNQVPRLEQWEQDMATSKTRTGCTRTRRNKIQRGSRAGVHCASNQL
ncbi:hypothetical protein AVEN_239937-1 [Araneus ventricosus]|uniref:Uncharacterized protein n=1 Tax=Araneus ventricosus TaxID=182803 RepID=A0A4Y2JJB0_ARAVE|nr:hypothetical protein AVEN_239937-1 [Araneus ventricosus]